MAINPLAYSSEGSLGDTLGTTTDTPNAPENFLVTKDNALVPNIAYAQSDEETAQEPSTSMYYSLSLWVVLILIIAVVSNYIYRHYR